MTIMTVKNGDMGIVIQQGNTGLNANLICVRMVKIKGRWYRVLEST